MKQKNEDTPQPNNPDEWLSPYVKRIRESINYKGNADCEDVISILKEIISKTLRL